MRWTIKILKPGDHIRVSRNSYFHHGIYVGNNEVIHFSSPSGDLSSNTKEIVVMKSSIDFFAKNSVVEVAELSFFEKLYSRPKNKRIKNAYSKLNEGDYDFLLNNCEDFVNKICYRKKLSSQIYSGTRLPNFVKIFIRGFLKFTGIVPYLFIRPRLFYVSEKAKADYEANRKGVVLVSNHTKICDYYCFIYKYLFKRLHVMAADVVYINRFVSFLNKCMENIKIKRNDGANLVAINESIFYLKKNHNLLIFPEGKLEDKAGVLENFASSYALIAKKANKPIIPFYIDGRYGVFKRPTIVVGEKIDPVDEIKNIVDAINLKEKEMVIKYKNHIKHRTQKIFTRKYWVLDFVRITSIPIFYLIFITKRFFVGDKKKIKRALKQNVLICGNHFGPCDPMFIYMFFKRRTKIIAAGEIWKIKPLGYALDRSGVIKYRRTANDAIDLSSFKESLDTLRGNGAVGIFPEGHISFDCKLQPFKEGAATLSLMTNSPIVPFVFVNPFKFFRFNKVIFGDPIYPCDAFKNGFKNNAETIKEYNEYIYGKMKELYEISLLKRGKNFGKRVYYKNF